MKNKKRILNSNIGIGILVVFWTICSIISQKGEGLIPTPVDVVQAMSELLRDKVLIEYLGISLYRFLLGYILSAIVAIILGFFLGWYTKVWNIVNPMVQILRPISPIAWFPFIVMIFGIGDLPAIVIIFIAGFFPILLSTVSAVEKIDKTYLKVASNFEIKGLKLMTKIVFPAVFPVIANALHVALGSAWIFLVAGEMVGAQSGLGYLIIDARNNLRSDMLLLGIILIGIIGLVLDKAIGNLERFILIKWGKGEPGI